MTRAIMLHISEKFVLAVGNRELSYLEIIQGFCKWVCVH
jgi:hypothetical protein